MNQDKKPRQSEVQAFNQFILEDRPSGDVVRLQSAIELAVQKLAEIAPDHIRGGTVRRYHMFMKELSDDCAKFISERMKRHRARLN